MSVNICPTNTNGLFLSDPAYLGNSGELVWQNIPKFVAMIVLVVVVVAVISGIFCTVFFQFRI